MKPIEIITHCLASAAPAETWPTLDDEAWDEVAVTALALGLGPLLHWHLERQGVTGPPRAMAKLALTRQAHGRRNRAIAGQLAEILAGCAGQQIDVLVLKGALLAASVYPDPALRPMNDIDLLIRPQDLPRLEQLFERLGYDGKHKPAAQGPGITKHLTTYRRAGRPGSTPNPYLSPDADRTVEPHRSLEESWFGLTVDITPGVWERATPCELHGYPAYQLSAGDMLLHLAVHAAFHVIMRASVFLQLYDIAQVAKSWQQSLNWTELLSLARRTKTQPFVYASFYWARTLYRAPIPEHVLLVLEQECPAGLGRYIRYLDARRHFARCQAPPLATLARRLQRGLWDRYDAARWAGSTAAKWKVWQTALAVHKTDTVALLKQRLSTVRYL
jgi:hypothetical protein